jgi:hypothetical protein
MKKLMIALLAIGFTGMIACNNKADADKKADGEKKENTTTTIAPDAKDAGTTTVADKEHACGAECKDGNHVYAHGEKDHACGDACKKDGAANEHKCGAECKDGNHVYAHGEKDHACGDACMKKG